MVIDAEESYEPYESVQIIKVYHCNDEKRVTKYQANLELIVSENNDSWLGTGMYFWDNIANAKYWEKEKKRKEKGCKYLIASNYLKIDERCFLDLTDDDIAKATEKMWLILAETLNKDPNISLGRKLNLLYDYCGFFNIIKVSARYDKMPKNDFFDEQIEKQPIPANNSKIIYLIKTNKSIYPPINLVK